MLTDDLRGALTRRNDLLRKHQRANELYRTATWIRARDRSAADNLPPDHDLGL
jgi:hypothetical protein